MVLKKQTVQFLKESYSVLMKHNILKYALSVLVAGLLIYYIANDDTNLKLIKSIEFFDILVALFIAIVVFVISGIQTGYILYKDSSVKLKTHDYLLLPVMMHLWSYILPTQGGLLFSSFYLSRKYGYRFSSGYALGFYTFLVGLIISGLIGLYFSLSSVPFNLPLLFISMAVVLSPLFLFVGRNIFRSVNIKIKLIQKILTTIETVTNNILNHLKERSYNVFIVGTTFVSIIIYIIWLVWATHTLDLSLTLPQMIMLTLATRLSLIVRFIPGNLGVQEMFAASGVAIVGGSFDDAILISVFLRFIGLLLAITIGVLGMAINSKYFSFREILNTKL